MDVSSVRWCGRVRKSIRNGAMCFISRPIGIMVPVAKTDNSQIKYPADTITDIVRFLGIARVI